MFGHTERRTFSASTSTVATACSLAAMTGETTRLRPLPGIEAAPPVTPNLIRSEEIPGARKVGQNTLETLLFRGISTPVAFALVVIQSRFLDPAGRGRFVLVVLSVTILARLFGQARRRGDEPEPGRRATPVGGTRTWVDGPARSWRR